MVPEMRSTDYDVVVVGAGMGGLAAATHLGVGGMKVLVLEQHHKVGGCATSFSRGEFNFDAAVHEIDGLGENGHLNKALKEAGIFDRIPFIRIPHLYRSVFPGGLDVTLPTDAEEMQGVLIARWPDEEKGIRDFFQLMRDIRADVVELGDMYRFNSWKRFWRIVFTPFARRSLFKYYDQTLEKALDDHFKSDELKAVVSQLWVFYGPPPSRMWAPIFFLANESYVYAGAWHIKGSSRVLSNAYAARIRELGGEVRTGTRVTAIQVEKGWVRGVETEHGESISARYVVSNADPFQTFYKLVGEEKTPESIKKKLNSLDTANSLVGVYLGLDVEPSYWDIKVHELFYNGTLDADEAFENMMNEEYQHGALAMTFYTNLGDDWYAPPGKSVLVMHSYADHANWPREREAYEQHKKEVTDSILSFAEELLPDLREHVVVLETVTPLSLEAFTMQHKGIPYGWDFTVDQALEFPENKTPIGGLYLAGSWTAPSHGVSAAQLSGYQAAHLILDGEGE